ncbi:GRB2-associated and regulator of MAPK protein 1 [Entelurus aequoreus]|uniref:GRB2-associated and regulator of MAPK protein 1 n=1 Tax=Entelurus aequoreus TaxID=161455 RepID=UPI002B1D4EDC|nr:GRB2-associated and regulator of MAPK protein 1 [Entelurus aequoreus]
MEACKMELGTMLYNNLKDVTWSTTSLPLDQLVSAYRLPQIVKLDNGQIVEGLRENDYLLIHSCRQWTTITAHSLEEGHYVIGPKIEIPVHYEGQFKLLEQDRDVKEPIQYFNSVEEVAKAFPERVYVMEEITFNVKMASGECNEDTEVYNITLSTGDELTLMGQAEILYTKTSKEKSRFNTIFKKIGKLNSISKMGRGKMPCLICMNHRTNESISLPFQCKGRFSTCSPLELQMQDGEHTIRNIVEKTRLPVNVTVPGSPPRNQHDLHLIREGNRYKLVNIQTKTVVVCLVLRSNKIVPVHFPFITALPRFIIPEELLQGELWLDTMVHRWFSFCQEQFDIDDYSRAVRDVRTDWNDEGKSPKKQSGGNGNCCSGGGTSNGCPNSMQIPSSLTYARDELTQSFHRLSVCVYGSNLHGNNEVNLQGCMTLCGDWALLPSDSLPADSAENEHVPPQMVDTKQQASNKSDVPYEELWLDRLGSQIPKSSLTEGVRALDNGCSTTTTTCSYPDLPLTSPLAPVPAHDASLTPPPVPPKSEAVKEECRLLNAPPIPPRSLKQTPSEPLVSKPRQQETRSPSPTLSYYSSGLHSIGGSEQEEVSDTHEKEKSVCYPCNWNHLTSTTSPSRKLSSRLSWPNNVSRTGSQSLDSYYSYPRKRTSNTQTNNFDARGSKSLSLRSKSSSTNSQMYKDIECNTNQSLSCPILPPRTSKLRSSEVTCAPTHVDQQDASNSQHTVSSAHSQQWQPPPSLAGLSIEEVSKCLRFIGLPDDIVLIFTREKIDGNFLMQLTEEILSEDFKLSKLQLTKLLQFIHGWRPKI